MGLLAPERRAARFLGKTPTARCRMPRARGIVVVVSLLACAPVAAQYLRPASLPEGPRSVAAIAATRDPSRWLAVEQGDSRSPVLAGALSAILPGTGLGSFYAGSPSHGLRHLFITLGLAVGIGVGCDLKENGCDGGEAFGTVGGVLILANAVWSVFAAVGDANRFNERAAAPLRAP
jgi:hypothetical protein